MSNEAKDQLINRIEDAVTEVCAQCHSPDCREVFAGDEGWTVCPDCRSIEQGYVEVIDCDVLSDVDLEAARELPEFGEYCLINERGAK